jgi:hypothetical protein
VQGSQELLPGCKLSFLHLLAVYKLPTPEQQKQKLLLSVSLTFIHSPIITAAKDIQSYW